MDDDGSGCIDQNEQNYILVTRKAKNITYKSIL